MVWFGEGPKCVKGVGRAVLVWSHLVEAAHQALSLLHHPSLDAPLHHALDVLLLVLLTQRDVCSARLQLTLSDLHTHTHTTL